MRYSILQDDDYTMWCRLSQAKDLIYRVRNQELSQFGITTMQSAVLVIIKILEGQGDMATPNNISKWLIREPHTASRIIARMEKGGLVKKIKGLGKGNELIIKITEKGEQAYRQSLKREAIHEIFSFLSEEEWRVLGSSLMKIRNKALQKLTQLEEMPFP